MISPKNKNAKSSTGFDGTKLGLTVGALTGFLLGATLVFAESPAKGPPLTFNGWGCLPDLSKRLRGEEAFTRDCRSPETFFVSLAGKLDASGDERRDRKACKKTVGRRAMGSAPSKIVGQHLLATGAIASDDQPFVVQEFASKTRGARIYRCCPRTPGMNGCAKFGTSWNECLCLAYIRYPGGQKALLEYARERKAAGN